jgi:hypothetical protein
MGGACKLCGGEEKCLQSLVGKFGAKRSLDNRGVNGRIILTIY